MFIASESKLNPKVGVTNNAASAWFIGHVADIWNTLRRDQKEELQWRDGPVRQESGVQNTPCKPDGGLMTAFRRTLDARFGKLGPGAQLIHNVVGTDGYGTSCLIMERWMRK